MIKTNIYFKPSDVVGKHARRSLRSQNFEPRERHPDEALPPQINKFAGKYEPSDMEPVRPGASDHLKIKSRGL